MRRGRKAARLNNSVGGNPMSDGMLCKLDYFSFTFPITLLGEKDNEYTLNTVLLCLHEHTAHRLLGIVSDSLWQWEVPVGFYRNRITCPRTNVQLQWSGDNPFALCTLSGHSVDLVLRSLSVVDLARCAGGRATRLDFAVDFKTDCSPSEFCTLRENGRIKTQGNFTSQTGETCYVGSRQGERMARVYRYNEPHPRSDLLRAEVELKGDAAKIACDALTKVELTEVCLQVHLPFGWKHPLWQPGDIAVSKLPARLYDSEGAGTLRWLDLTVAPAIKKAAENGLIDLTEWLRSHFPALPL